MVMESKCRGAVAISRQPLSSMKNFRRAAMSFLFLICRVNSSLRFSSMTSTVRFFSRFVLRMSGTSWSWTVWSSSSVWSCS